MLLPTTSNTESSGNATSRTRFTANDQPLRVGRESGEQSIAAEVRAPRGAPPAHRQSLIDRVCLQIASGTYVTQAKIDALLPRLVEDL